MSHKTVHAYSTILTLLANQLRILSIEQTTAAQSGHPTSCLSAADIVAALFFYAMRYDKDNYNSLDNDRFILSKGHAAPLLYAAWHELGKISYEELMTYRQRNSRLEGHPTARFPYAEAATGSLGMGLSIGVGEALSIKADARSAKIFVLMGDSECSEGSVWEAIQIAAHYNLDNLIGIIDVNGLGQSTETLYDHHLTTMQEQMRAFGWHTLIVDGHDMRQLMTAFDTARTMTNTPIMILARTVKGSGVSFLENKQGWHGKPLRNEEKNKAIDELKKRGVASVADYRTEIDTYVAQKIEFHTPPPQLYTVPSDSNTSFPLHALGTLIATRQAYGEALATLGNTHQTIISLDAEVKNSTYAELFEHAFPERFFQCFVAEQNMVGMGIGFVKQGKIPFISTFGAFFTRAYDQIRMAAIGNVPLRLVGSHCGVSIGQDGPSQMALEDISMICAIPNTIVLYPSDATSTYRLVAIMVSYHDGISYLRTTRAATPVLYHPDEQFFVGGCKVLRESTHDVACIVAAGITVHEALKAYDCLRNQPKPLFVAVIDLYSVKPFDEKTVMDIAQKSSKKIIVVEDHYASGGIGEKIAAALCNTNITVYSLAVRGIPHSATPEEQLSFAGIDRESIVEAVYQIHALVDQK